MQKLDAYIFGSVLTYASKMKFISQKTDKGSNFQIKIKKKRKYFKLIVHILCCESFF